MQELCSAHSFRVLLIEDNSADAQLVRALLADEEESGVAFEVTWVRGLAAARDALGRSRFDAALLDLRLPDANGTDLVATLHDLAPELAIIVTSGQDAADCLLARAIIRKGAEDFLPKDSLTGALLARTITTAIERSRRSTALQARTAQLAAVLNDARIGHLSWVPDSPEATPAGDVARLFGLSAADPYVSPHLSMRRLLQHLPGSARRSLFAAWRELRAGADRLAVVLLEDDRPAPGGGHDLLLDIVVRRDEASRILRVDALIRDTAMVGHVERLESELIGHLGHELRTPLTTIRATLGLLAHEAAGLLTASTRTLVDNAIASAERINRVIGDTLGLHADRRPRSRVESRRVPLGPHLADALAAHLPEQTATTGGPGLTLTARSRTLDVMVDTARLRRAVDCLRAQLRAGGGRADRRSLDVSLVGDIAWLKLAPPQADSDGSAAAPAGSPASVEPTPASPADPGTAGELCIAVPLAGRASALREARP